jgi:hypothetical protein
MRSEFAANLALQPVQGGRPVNPVIAKPLLPSPAGRVGVPFIELVRDTIDTHGIRWALAYYSARMPQWEARFWMKSALAV